MDEIKIIFLDFDGVLNSSASFVMEDRKNKALKGPKKRNKVKINETLCHVCCSNFQLILDVVPDAKIVISSTWRELFDLEWLKEKLASYGIDSSRVIDRTPATFGGYRGREIRMWLDDHPEVKQFVILDDNPIDGGRFNSDEADAERIVKTKWDNGLQLEHVFKAIQILGVDPTKHRDRLPL